MGVNASADAAGTPSPTPIARICGIDVARTAHRVRSPRHQRLRPPRAGDPSTTDEEREVPVVAMLPLAVRTFATRRHST